MKKVTNENVMVIRIALEKALKSAEETLDMEFSLGAITYSDLGVKVKLTGRLIGAEPETVVDYRHVSENDELMPQLDTIIILNNGRHYLVTGWKRSARKNKVIVTDMCGKGYVISYRQLVNAKVISLPE